MKIDKRIKPRLIAFELTRRCRFDCAYCRANAGYSPKPELDTGQCKKILTAIARFSRKFARPSKTRKPPPGPVIILTGGEPMERADIYQLIRHSRRLNLQPVLATCGYLINDNSIARLKKAGILALSFPLDGASADTHDAFTRTKGSFEAVLKAAALAHRARIRFQINSTISNANISEIIGIAELAKEIGAYCFNPFILVPTGRAAQATDIVIDPVQYETLLNELLDIKVNSKIHVRVTCGPQFARVCRQSRFERITGRVEGCMGGRGFGFINYRGDVQMCGFLDISAGNLIENNFNFEKIWLESEFLNDVRDLSGYRAMCKICEYGEICGGCRARAFAMTGDYLATDPVCGYKPRQKDSS